MPTYKITSDSLTAGRITRKIMAANYPDALSIVDDYVDELDGIYKPLDVDNLPPTLSFGELLSGEWGEFHNYIANKITQRWHIVLKNGWIYSGEAGCDIGRRCGPLERLDPHLLYAGD